MYYVYGPPNFTETQINTPSSEAHKWWELKQGKDVIVIRDW